VTTTKNITKLQVSSAEIAGMQTAAAIIRGIRGTLASHDNGILATMAGAEALVDWRHYPAGDVYDPTTHAQYFYHVHSSEQRAPREHGHFHIFLRAEGMPLGVAPLVLPESAVADVSPAAPQAAPLKRGCRDEVAHLAAVTVSARGEPIRLFTTNRWVTGETWYRADDVIRMLGRFSVDAGDGPALLNQWVSAVVALFRPQIACLLRLRDDAVMGWRRRRRTNVFEDARLEVTSSFEIDLDSQFAFLDQVQAHRSPACAVHSAWVVQAAQGWGEGQTH
jgi:Domain of unknown function (DUF6969)